MNMHLATNSNKQAFTLVELLLVIGIISVIASAALVMVQSGANQAQASRIAAEINQIKKAFSQAFQEYPTEDDLGLGGNPTIRSMIDANMFNDDLIEIFETPLGDYHYDNDESANTTFEDCSAPANSSGVNIIFPRLSSENDREIFSKLDELIDNADGFDCGRTRLVNSIPVVMIQPDPARFP